MRLEVGPFAFRARRVDGGPLRLAADDAHADFLAPDGPADAELFVETSPPPPAAVGPSLFVHRAQWHVRADGDDWSLQLLAPAHRPHLQRLVRATRDFSALRLWTSGDDPRPGEPFAWLLPELIALGLSVRKPALLLHAAAFEVGGRAVLAAGMSGAGKSTLARLAVECGLRGLGDETALLAAAGGGAVVHGTPWFGSSRVWATGRAPLAAVLLLEHGAENELHPLGGAQAAAELLSHAFLPTWDEVGVAGAASLAAAVAQAVPVRRFAFRPEREAVEMIRRFVGTLPGE